MAIFLLPFSVNAQTADFSFSLSDHCNDGTATFTDLSGPGQVNHWVWSFGNYKGLDTTDPAKGKNPSASYTTPGVYTVSLAVNGGTPVTKKITINPTPTGDFTITKKNACGLGDVDLKASASISSGLIKEYRWDIDNDGSIEAIAETYTHNFSKTGTFDISLTLLSEAGCSSTKIIKPIKFNDGNTADFTIIGDGTYCSYEWMILRDASSPTPVAWAWDTGHGRFPDPAGPGHKPSGPLHISGYHGAYFYVGDVLDIRLRVTHSDGCVMISPTKKITLTDVTIPFFTYKAACPPNYYNVAFTDVPGQTHELNLFKNMRLFA